MSVYCKIKVTGKLQNLDGLTCFLYFLNAYCDFRCGYHFDVARVKVKSVYKLVCSCKLIYPSCAKSNISVVCRLAALKHSVSKSNKTLAINIISAQSDFFLELYKIVISQSAYYYFETGISVIPRNVGIFIKGDQRSQSS